MSAQRKRFSSALTVTPGERSVVARITTAAVDRDGDVLLPQGCDASQFLSNPTVFFNHDYGLPVGRCAAIRQTDQGVEAKTVFAARPTDHDGAWLPDTLLALFQQEVLRGFSVGFMPIETRRASRADRERFGRDVRRVFSKWRLLEYSVAPMPANPEALALAVSKGLLSAEEARRLFDADQTQTAPDATSDTAPNAAPSPPPGRKRVVLIPACRPAPPAFSLHTLIDDEIRRRRGDLYAD